MSKNPGVSREGRGVCGPKQGPKHGPKQGQTRMRAEPNRPPRYRDLLDAHRREKGAAEWRGDWGVALFARPASFPLVWLLARTRVSPTAVTLSSVPLVAAMPAIALLAPPALAGPLVVLCACLFQVIDCVDGGLARATGRFSRLGGTLDFLIDMVQWGVFYATVGLLADQALGTGALWTALGLVAGWTRLYARVVRDAAEPARVETAGEGGETAPAGRMTPLDLIHAFFAGLSGALPVALLLAWWAEALPALLVFLLLYSAADVIEALALTVRRQAQ